MRADNSLLAEVNRRIAEQERHYGVAQLMAFVIAAGLIAWALIVGGIVP